LCIARAIAVEPEIILLDEPCSRWTVSTLKIEDLMRNLVAQYQSSIVPTTCSSGTVFDMACFFWRIRTGQEY